MNMMTLQVLEGILLASLLINGTILVLWSVIFSVFKDQVIKIQKYFIDVDEETITAVVYFLLGFYKVLILFFNVIPYLALLIIS